jgi:2-aminoadipate transaminase
VLDRLLQADGRTAAELNVSVDQVVITPGSNQFLFLLSDVLMDPGDIVICGAPTYFVYLETLINLGIRSVGVETDEHGIIPDAIEAELTHRKSLGELERVKAIYVTTYFDNPSGVTVPEKRRSELVELAKRWSRESKLFIIEDAAYRELRYLSDDIPSLRSFDPDGDTVVHTGTFSKAFSPGIRVGWGILPKPLLQPVLAEKGNLDFGSPNLNQVLMSTIMQRKLFERHLEMGRKNYREKLDVTLQAVEEYLSPVKGAKWLCPTGGLYVWLWLPEHINAGIDGPLFDCAAEEGVLYVPGEYCYPREGAPMQKNTIRLTFGIQSRESIRRGVESLARAIRQVL